MIELSTEQITYKLDIVQNIKKKCYSRFKFEVGSSSYIMGDSQVRV